MELSLSSCLGGLPTSGVLNLTTIDFGGELSDVDYQSSFSKIALFHPSVFSGERFDGGCMYLEREQHTEVPLLDDILFLLCASPK